MKLKVEYRGGVNNLVCGNYPLTGTVLALIDPWGNSLGQVMAGSKPEHGLGGFEFVATNPAPGYDLHTNGVPGWEFEHRAGLTFLTWEEDEPPPPPPPEPPPPDDVEVDPRIAEFLTIKQIEGAKYKLVKVDWQDDLEAKGDHTCYVNVAYLCGEPVGGVPVRFFNGGSVESVTDAFGWTNFPMYATLGSYGVYVGAPDESDEIRGLGLGIPQYPDVKYHTNFILWFKQQEDCPPPPEPPPPPPPEPPPPEWKWMSELMERLDRIIELLEEIAGG